MKLHCTKCKASVTIIVKLGGLICERCRVILKYPYDPEYDEALTEIRGSK